MSKTVALLVLSTALAACAKPTEQTTSASTGADNPTVVAESIDFDDKECAAKGLPIALTIKNNGAQPTRAVSWHFAVNRANHSDNLTVLDMAVPFSDPNRRTDRIIAPGESFKVCSTAPILNGISPDAPDLEYRVSFDAPM